LICRLERKPTARTPSIWVIPFYRIIPYGSVRGLIYLFGSIRQRIHTQKPLCGFLPQPHFFLRSSPVKERFQNAVAFPLAKIEKTPDFFFFN